MKQTILLMCLSLSLFMSCNNDHETDLLSTKSQDEVKTLSFLYHDTLYTSSYTGDLNIKAKIVDERVKNIYDEIQDREELAFIENEDGVIEYFDSQEDAITKQRIILAERTIGTRNSSGRGDYLPDGSVVLTFKDGDRVWTTVTKVDPNNSNKYYVKVTGNDATKRRVARGDGGYIYPRNNKDRPVAQIGTEVPPFSSYVEVYEYSYSLTDNGRVTIKSIIPDYSAGGMMYNEIAGQKKYAELDTYVSTNQRKVEQGRNPGTFIYLTDYTLKTYIYNFLLGGGSRFTGFYPFSKDNAIIAYWVEYLPTSDDRVPNRPSSGRN